MYIRILGVIVAGFTASLACGGCYDLQIECDTSQDCVADSRFGEGHICSYRQCIPAECSGEACDKSNVCGGSAELGEEPGASCGNCDDGYIACTDADSVECLWAGETNACGGCSTLAHDTGNTCGACGDGALVCDALTGRHRCADATPTNSCGGCSELAGLPLQPCTDALGVAGIWGCINSDEVACRGTGENPCSGDEALDEVIGAPCGTCTLGRWSCDPTTGGARCDESLVEANACGGCAPLAGVPGESCGECGVWRCDEDGNDRVVCADRPNACGGCDPLQGAPGVPCGDGNITFCAGADTLGCAPPPVNACGGDEGLSETPGTACGECGGGKNLCASPDLVVCVGDDRENACGGCELLIEEPGQSCAPGHRWTCDGSIGNVRCLPFDPTLCDAVSECVNGDACCPESCIGADSECVPSRVASVSASDGTDTEHVEVSWPDSGGADHYALLRDGELISEFASSPFSDTEASPGGITWSDISATPEHGSIALEVAGVTSQSGFEHTYKVVAINQAGAALVSPSDTGFRGVGDLSLAWEAAPSEGGPWEELPPGPTALHQPDNPGPWFYRARLSADGATATVTDTIEATMFVCGDGVQNGTEQGIDCGGPCTNSCGEVAFADEQVPPDVIRAWDWTWTPAWSGPDTSTPQFAIDSGPEGLAIDESTGELSWLTNSFDLGTHTVTITIDDAVTGTSDQIDVELLVRDSKIVHIDGQAAIMCAVDEVGRVFCWGDPFVYDLGVTNAVSPPFGDSIASLLNCDESTYAGTSNWPGACGALPFALDAVGVAVGGAHICVWSDDGQVECRGDETLGQLGSGPLVPGTEAFDISHRFVELSSAAIQVTAGLVHSCARTTNGQAQCWGAESALLSDGTTLQRLSGRQAEDGEIVELSFGDTEVIEIDAGTLHTCAMTSDDAVHCWGDNSFGKLGLARSDQPSQTMDATELPAVNLGVIPRSIAASQNSTCVGTTDGQLVCWGAFARGNFVGASVPYVGRRRTPR